MKKRLLTMVCMMVAMVIAMLMPVTAHAESGRDLYCLRNPQTGEYLYTIDPKEKANLEGTWHYEGFVCKMPATSSVPTYRLLNSANGQHLYTASDAEITKLVGEGWTKEGVAYYVDDAKTAPIYRLFNTSTGDHAFGSDATAADMEAKGWTREGVAFYALWANADLRYSAGGKTVAAKAAATPASGMISPTNDFFVIRGEGLDLYFYSPLYQRSSQEVKAQIVATQMEMYKHFDKWAHANYGNTLVLADQIWEPLGKWNGIEIERWTIDNVRVGDQVIKLESPAYYPAGSR
ncbi:MAG: hypothetical protein IJ791_10765 [Lachnospiraceae bacterium]|nr:hypothetical protein [Lachnospiraceae bacterium]